MNEQMTVEYTCWRCKEKFIHPVEVIYLTALTGERAVLCPECSRQLRRWLNGNKGEEWIDGVIPTANMRWESNRLQLSPGLGYEGAMEAQRERNAYNR